MKWPIKQHALSPHHKYQIETVLLFVIGFFFFIPYFVLVQKLNLNIYAWQWYFFWPWMLVYVGYLLYIRQKIKKSEKTSPLKRPIFHWALLGVTMTFVYSNPSDPTAFSSIHLMFGIFSLFLADSYWDFRRGKILKKKKV